MGYAPSIRVLALGLITHNTRIFVSEGYDPKKQEKFYRSLGGGVEFGEYSAQALEREFQEEIQAELKNIRYLGCFENIFVFNGSPGHEIVQLYGCDFVDPKFYEHDSFKFYEGKHEKLAMWVECEEFLSGKSTLYPLGIEKFLIPLT